MTNTFKDTNLFMDNTLSKKNVTCDLSIKDETVYGFKYLLEKINIKTGIKETTKMPSSRVSLV